MLFYKEKDTDSNKIVYPFRTINQDKVVVGLKMSYYGNPNFSEENVVKHLNLQAERFKKDFKTIREDIIKTWCEMQPITHEESTEDEQLVWDYIVYKMLKISKNYNRYHKINRNLRQNFNYDLLKKHIEELYLDRSHVTTKLRRALFFTKTNIFKNRGKDIFLLNEVEEEMALAGLSWENAIYKVDNKQILMKDAPEHDELLPPPIYDISLLIIEKDKIKTDGSFDQKETFPYDGLSSGEKQVASVISNFVYHLVNINSVWKYKHKPQTEEEKLVRYFYVNIVFDEVELYFHPDLQRRFVKLVTDALRNVTLENIWGVNILIVTHSPFVLSDIPSSNVLFLRAKGKEVVPRETFASNIHQMLGNSFFMEYTIGDVAREALQEVYRLYANLINKSVDGAAQQEWLEKEDYYRYVGNIISDDYLRNSYQMMLQELMKAYHPKAAVEAEKAALRARLTELEKEDDD